MSKQLDKYNEFIRDITSVAPMSKSEARRRLDDLLSNERKRIIDSFPEEKKINREFSWAGMVRPWSEGYNACLQEIKSKLEE